MADKKEVEVKKDEVFNEALGKDYISPLPLPLRLLAYAFLIFMAFSALYFFLIGISVLSDAFKLIAGTGAGEVFTGTTNPIAGLMIGVLATVLVQSSSTTTSIITVLVGDGLVPLESGIPMIMGANIGTSVTNTIVAFSLIGEGQLAYERGFSGATVHDMFNYLNVLVFLPLELIVDLLNPNGGGLLEIISGAMVPDEFSGEGKPDNKIKEWTAVVKGKIVSTDKGVVTDIARGIPEAADCATTTDDITFKFSTKQYDPSSYTYCINGSISEVVPAEINGEPNVENLTDFEIVRKLFNEAKLLSGGFLFEKNKGDKEAGVALLFLSLFMMILCLSTIVKSLSMIMRGPARVYMRKVLNFDELLPEVFYSSPFLKALHIGGWLSIAAGAGLTFFVQSSSITTSVLTPMVAADLLTLENMFPYTLGANIGTTTTALLAAIADQKPLALQIAFVHLLFNCLGTLLWFPLPFMRAIPVGLARFLGRTTYITKTAPLVYIALAFLIYPALFFGIASGYAADGAGPKVVSTIVVLLIVGVHGGALYYYVKMGGREKLLAFIEEKRTTKLGEPAGASILSATDI